MSQSFVKFYAHIVFHTKNNVKFIREEIEDELYSYLGGILRNCKSIPVQIGGTSESIMQKFLLLMSIRVCLMKTGLNMRKSIFDIFYSAPTGLLPDVV